MITKQKILKIINNYILIIIYFKQRSSQEEVRSCKEVAEKKQRRGKLSQIEKVIFIL